MGKAGRWQEQGFRLRLGLARFSITLAYLLASGCCALTGWPQVDQMKDSLRCGLSHEEVFALAVENGGRFDCGLSTDLDTCSAGRCYRFIRGRFGPGKGLISYQDLKYGPFTRVQQIEERNLCQEPDSVPKGETETTKAPLHVEGGTLSRRGEPPPTPRERQFEKKFVCGITPTTIRFDAFQLESRSFLCESAPPFLVCFIVFDTRAYRTSFSGEHLEMVAVGKATGMKGSDYGGNKNLCAPAPR